MKEMEEIDRNLTLVGINRGEQRRRKLLVSQQHNTLFLYKYSMHIEYDGPSVVLVQHPVPKSWAGLVPPPLTSTLGNRNKGKTKRK
jgi:hypothetical protein